MTVYIAFGSNCTPADALKFGGLRDFALPFDYIFAFPDTIKHSLDTDFEEWFDIDKMSVHSDDPNDIKRIWTKHSKYRAHTKDHIAGFFMHHDMTDLSVQETFKKRIQRYKDIVASDKDIVFFTSSSPKDIQENGLLNYHNRSAKTTFVYLRHLGSDTNYANSVLEDGNIFIDYKSIGRMNESAGKLICNKLRDYDSLLTSPEICATLDT